MPSFSRVRSAWLLASCLVLFLSLVCPARMENIVVAAALLHVVHSLCHFCLASSASTWYR